MEFKATLLFSGVLFSKSNSILYSHLLHRILCNASYNTSWHCFPGTFPSLADFKMTWIPSAFLWFMLSPYIIHFVSISLCLKITVLICFPQFFSRFSSALLLDQFFTFSVFQILSTKFCHAHFSPTEIIYIY